MIDFFDESFTELIGFNKVVVVERKEEYNTAKKTCEASTMNWDTIFDKLKACKSGQLQKLLTTYDITFSTQNYNIRRLLTDEEKCNCDNPNAVHLDVTVYMATKEEFKK